MIAATAAPSALGGSGSATASGGDARAAADPDAKHARNVRKAAEHGVSLGWDADAAARFAEARIGRKAKFPVKIVTSWVTNEATPAELDALRDGSWTAQSAPTRSARAETPAKPASASKSRTAGKRTRSTRTPSAKKATAAPAKKVTPADLAAAAKRVVTPDGPGEDLAAVAESTGIPESTLSARCRTESLALARHAFLTKDEPLGDVLEKYDGHDHPDLRSTLLADKAKQENDIRERDERIHERDERLRKRQGRSRSSGVVAPFPAAERLIDDEQSASWTDTDDYDPAIGF
ncbi:MAG: hypothetical protein ABS81_14605 [Pseudonocardia sp. SCN 72-86]|nr:MAG: hypothetical protein ABS81_14605 [Pseudonocardia sp. SCN 72-86]